MDGVTYLTNLFDNRFRAPTMNSPFDYGIARSLRNAQVRVTHAKVTPRSDLWRLFNFKRAVVISLS